MMLRSSCHSSGLRRALAGDDVTDREEAHGHRKHGKVAVVQPDLQLILQSDLQL